MKNKLYSTEEIFKGILELNKEERCSLLKRMTIENLASVVSDKSIYCKAMGEVEAQIQEWEAARSGVEKLSKNLKQENSKGIYKYANVEVMPEIDGYTFARLVNVVSNVTQKSLHSTSEKLYDILWRLYILRASDRAIKINNPTVIISKEDIENNVMMLNQLAITFETKTFWILDKINKMWAAYSHVEKAAIAKAICGIYGTEEFLTLMENWDKVDEPVISRKVEEILSELKEIGVKIGENMEAKKLDYEASSKRLRADLVNTFNKCGDFRGALDYVAKCYDNANEDERQVIVKIISGSSNE